MGQNLYKMIASQPARTSFLVGVTFCVVHRTGEKRLTLEHPGCPGVKLMLFLPVKDYHAQERICCTQLEVMVSESVNGTCFCRRIDIPVLWANSGGLVTVGRVQPVQSTESTSKNNLGPSDVPLNSWSLSGRAHLNVFGDLLVGGGLGGDLDNCSCWCAVNDRRAQDSSWELGDSSI